MTTIEEKNLKKLTRLFALMDEDALTREEFLKQFEKVLNIVKKNQEDNLKAVEALKNNYNKIIDNLDNKKNSDISDIKITARKEIGEMIKKYKQELANINQKIDTKLRLVRDGIDGKDADEKAIIKSVLEQIKIPEELEIDNIEGLRKELNDIKQMRRLGGGGGISDIGVQMSLSRIIQTETPSGTINGTNKEFTTVAEIGSVLSFAINGMAITDDEYTISGNTITFTTAIPADLSGKSFRIAYIAKI